MIEGDLDESELIQKKNLIKKILEDNKEYERSAEEETDLLKMKCWKCFHEWSPRTKNPFECPNCKSRKWKVEKK